MIPGDLCRSPTIGSIHRLRWGDIDGDKRLDLVVAPIFGPKAKPPAYAESRELGIFRNLDWRRRTPPKIERITVLAGHARH